MAFTARPPDMSFRANALSGLGAGIEKAGDAISQLIERKKTQEKLIKQSQQLLGLLQTLPEFKSLIPEGVIQNTKPRDLPMLTSNLITLENMSRRQREQDRAAAQDALLRQERTGNIAMKAQQLAQMKAQGQATAELPRFFDTLTSTLGAEAPKFVAPRFMTEEGAYNQLGALGQAMRVAPGAVAAPEFENKMKAFEALTAPGENLTPDVWQDPKTGARMFMRGKTSIPTGTDPEFYGRLQETMPNISGYAAAPTGRGGVTWLKTQLEGLTTDQKIKLLDIKSKQIRDDYSLSEEGREAGLREIKAEMDALTGPPALATDAPARTQGKRISVSTQAQYDALPSGTHYKGPDGKLYRKP